MIFIFIVVDPRLSYKVFILLYLTRYYKVHQIHHHDDIIQVIFDVIRVI